jgi:hypothetical protein
VLLGAQSSFTCTACAPGTFASQAGSTICTVCPAGFYCPNITQDPLAIVPLRGVINSQQTATGLTDFTCRRGYFRSNNRYCCNYNTRYSPEHANCTLCMPGFVYSLEMQECVS